jgi:hypothetical protein
MATEIFGKKIAPTNEEKNQRQTINIRRFVVCLVSVAIDDSTDNESIAVLNQEKFKNSISLIFFISPSTK